ATGRPVRVELNHDVKNVGVMKTMRAAYLINLKSDAMFGAIIFNMNNKVPASRNRYLLLT
ncbi:MAG: hypothetical protein K2Y56_17755, partial [Methylobacterium sp.]|uniref:hypothetical protein n=1 Tax=Methylobacterium sp. TaxID=409 RepID=UPI0025E549F2